MEADDTAPLGKGSGTDFTFASPAAQSEWRRRAYAQAVHPDNWHLGDSTDPESARAITAGVSGPTAPIYRGPDGRHYFANPKTIEPDAWREIRGRHFKGRTITDLTEEVDQTGHMPGETEALALQTAPNSVAQDNAPASPSPRPDNATLSPQGRAILAGMEHARASEPQIVARLAQSEGDTRLDADPAGTLPTTAQPDSDAAPHRRIPEITGEKRRPQPLASTARDYEKDPEPVPTDLLPKTGGQKIWPEIPADWIAQDRRGYPVFTPEASQELDRYKNEISGEPEKYARLIRRLAPNAPTYTGELLQHYLEGSGAEFPVRPHETLLTDQSIASADNALHNHIVSWLTNPRQTDKVAEAIVPKILALKDGESVTVPSLWNGATGEIAALFAPMTTPTTWTAFGNVQIRGESLATVTRRGDRYLAIVDVKKTLIDRYDFTDDDGETSANGLVKLANLFGSDLRSIDLAKMYLLAATGRSQPFDIRASWETKIVAELRRLPPIRMMSTNKLQLVEQEITSTFPSTQDPPAQDPPL